MDYEPSFRAMIICPRCSSRLKAELQCTACGWTARFIDGVVSMLDESVDADLATSEYRINYDQIAENDLSESIMDEALVRNLAENLVRNLPTVSGLDVCDLGAGKGFASRLLAARGARAVTAVDISIAYLRTLVGIANVRPVMADAENLPFDEEFDAIVSTDVMEHVLNLGSFLFCVNRALRPNGIFVVRVPYRESLLPYSKHLGCEYQFLHLRTFDKQGLRDSLEQAGFKVEKIRFDAFFESRPRKLWTRSRGSKKVYNFLLRMLLGEASAQQYKATQLPPQLAKLLMKQITIVATCRKVGSIVPLGAGNYRIEQ